MRKWREINYLRVQICPITKLIRNKNISFIYKRDIFFLGMSSVMVASHIVLPTCFLNEYNTFLLIIVTMISNRYEHGDFEICNKRHNFYLVSNNPYVCNSLKNKSFMLKFSPN